MRIGIVNWSLLETKGGIERFCCNLAGVMGTKGHSATLFCKAGKSPDARPTYPVPEKVPLIPLDLDYGTLDLTPAKTAIVSSGIDVLVACFSWESLLWFPSLLKGTGIPLVISERNHPELINNKWNAYERNACLSAADQIHILLEQFLPLYSEELRGLVTAIPNPVAPLDTVIKKAAGTRRTLLGVGRFSESVKQFSLLLEAFALLADDFPDWDLRICGDGDAFAQYSRWVSASGLGERISLPGRVENVAEEYAHADIFCIPSRYEGFGQVTTEAQQFALPVVGFRDCSGTNSIVVHEENGFLAEAMTPACLAGYLALLMRDAALRTRLGQRGKEMLLRYDPQTVYGAWETLLLKAAAVKGHTRLQSVEQGGKESGPLMEILNRPHPFDRHTYLAMHRACRTAGEPSPFSESHIAGFRKKMKRFGLSGKKLYMRKFTSWFGGLFSLKPSRM